MTNRSTVLQKFYDLNCGTDVIGLIKREEQDVYFCTPEGAEVFAWLGVDGIHFCFIPSLQLEQELENGMVYAVTPMDPEEYVKPVAHNLKEFLEMTIACGDAGVLEQVGNLSEEQYKELIKDVEISSEMQEVITKIKIELGIEPCNELFERIHELQKEFDYSSIPFSDEYYDVTGMERE